MQPGFYVMQEEDIIIDPYTYVKTRVFQRVHATCLLAQLAKIPVGLDGYVKPQAGFAVNIDARLLSLGEAA